MRQAILLGLCCNLVAAGPAMAQPTGVQNFEFGPEAYYFNYEEPGVMEEEGAFYGLGAAYSYHENSLMLGLDGRLAFGSVDYTSTSTGSIDDIDDYLFETRGIIGTDVDATDTLVLTPFTGLGYRYLNDDTGGRTSTTGARGYEREANYVYSPVGLAARWTGQQGWSVSLSGEYDLFWFGVQKSHLSDASPTFNDLENDQDEGYGARASLAVEKKGQAVDWIVETFLRYWDIDDSDAVPVTFSGVIIGLGFEPANETYELGGRITAKF